MTDFEPDSVTLALRDRLPQQALDLLDCKDGRYSEWATACSVATYAMNAGFTEDEFVAVAAASDFAYEFATENGRDRSTRLESRLSKAWGKVEDAWNPPLGSAEEVRHKLEALSQRLEAHKWSGRTGGSDRAVALAVVQWGHEVGVWTLGASSRELSVRAGVARTTAEKALVRLVALGVLRKDTGTERERTHAQRWVIQLGWNQKCITSPHGSSLGGKGSYGLGTHTQHPVFLRAALGQTAERVWLDLIDHPDSSVGDVAERLGVAVTTVRRTLDGKLVTNQLAVRSDGRPSTYRIDPSSDLDRVAAGYGVTDWYERTAERYDRERAAFTELNRMKETAVKDDQNSGGEFSPPEPKPVIGQDDETYPDPFASAPEWFTQERERQSAVIETAVEILDPFDDRVSETA
ncbi:hypothetical protein [Mycolicibacterium hippocampi]|uniref:Uncharacterized protein n=1 Tax=Mycolicibacterium hippocampi TaxID=659824 RepID=A0A850PUR3_9MYCO|nr:hypothetical protein [Mycolicibacterium hippocampi]NVN51306.1 hypothetical protein [Mycolicibacterium hippocampi]